MKLDEERVELAKKVVLVAKADVEAAMARLEEAQAELAGYRRGGRPLGLGGQAARGRGQARSASIPRTSSRPRIAGRRASRRGTRRRRPS